MQALYSSTLLASMLAWSAITLLIAGAAAVRLLLVVDRHEAERSAQLMLRMLQLSVVFASAGAATIVWLVFGNRTDDGTAPILLGTFAIILAISLGAILCSGLPKVAVGWMLRHREIRHSR